MKKRKRRKKRRKKKRKRKKRRRTRSLSRRDEGTRFVIEGRFEEKLSM